MNKSQPWICSARFDLALIVAPAIFITMLVLIFHQQIEQLKDIPPFLWGLLIVGVDVGHVYSTIFRTYLDKEELQKRQSLYILTPLFAWVIGCVLYSINNLIFWRVLAYLALFHFVRQQYGFMMIYSRKERNSAVAYRLIDKAAIYLATIYPIIYWHCNSREFEWFIKDDFLIINSPIVNIIALIAYIIVLLIYIIKEFALWKSGSMFNIPKNLLLFGTAFSWFVGIVAFNNDLAFTATNVVAHGVPYFALIWLYGHNQSDIQREKSTYILPWISKLFCFKNIPFFIIIPLVFAFVEEGLWDGLIWRENGDLFWFSDALPYITDSNILVWMVPLLALPQITHYILDAFIWRMAAKGTAWKNYLFYQTLGKS